MKRSFTTVAVVVAPIALMSAVALVLLSGCGSHSASNRQESTAMGGGTEGSGVLATQNRNVADFTRLDLAGTSKVIVRVGAPKSVVIHGDDNLMRLITTKVADGTLVVSQAGDFTSHRGIQVDVAIPSLAGVTLSGTGDLAVTGVRADRFKVDLSGAGRLEVSGTAKRVDASLTGVGAARLGRLLSSDTHVVVSGTGSATVVATKSLDASVSGTGSVTYHGNPQHIKTSVTGTGSVIPG
jgi:Putative auto-transporter adhesin, head GIN domain